MFTMLMMLQPIQTKTTMTIIPMTTYDTQYPTHTVTYMLRIQCQLLLRITFAEFLPLSYKTISEM